LAGTIDLFPTLARLAGAAPAAERRIDGLDIWPLLAGQHGARTPHAAWFYYWDRHLQAVRSGPWKLHFPHAYVKPAPAGRDSRPGQYANPRIGLELFTLDNDLGEATNVAAQHPDVVQHLENLAEGCRTDLGDSATKVEGRNVRPPGRRLDPP
jgi:arylsulfatase A